MIQAEMTETSPVSRASLPSAAQRWLDAALPQDLNLLSSIKIDHEGDMDIRGKWTLFKASGVYRAAPLSFNWQARLGILPGVWIVAEDGHESGRGWGRARLWGRIPMGERTGHEVLLTQLVRNLAELPWLPSFALIAPGLAWFDSGESAFEIRASAGDREAVVRFEVDDQDDVIRAHSPSRPYDIPGGYAEAPWGYEFSDHRDFGGVRLPAVAAAAFDKGDGSSEYLRCRVVGVAAHELPA